VAAEEAAAKKAIEEKTARDLGSYLSRIHRCIFLQAAVNAVFVKAYCAITLSRQFCSCETANAKRRVKFSRAEKYSGCGLRHHSTHHVLIISRC